jgi:hypothetical protein
MLVGKYRLEVETTVVIGPNPARQNFLTSYCEKLSIILFWIGISIFHNKNLNICEQLQAVPPAAVMPSAMSFTVHIVTYMECDYRCGLDWRMDLLTTYKS